MNRFAIAILLLASLPALAKDKYPLTGTVHFEATVMNSEAHASVDGQRYDAYCNTTDTSVSCTDSPGNFYATLGDMKVIISTPYIPRSHSDENPVVNAEKAGQDGKFQYRLTTTWGNTTEDVSNAKFFCVPDSRGKEVCYDIVKAIR